MEGRLGHDFGDVRVHDDSRAHDSAVGVNANAYTVGSNIVFQRDRYDPSSSEGKLTLAHELTHVVQQRSGPVDGTPASGGIKVSDPSDRFDREAAANAERVMSGPAPAVTPAASGPSVQRCGDDGEHDVQRSVDSAEPAVQREGEEDEEEEPVQGSFTDAAAQARGRGRGGGPRGLTLAVHSVYGYSCWAECDGLICGVTARPGATGGPKRGAEIAVSARSL